MESPIYKKTIIFLISFILIFTAKSYADDTTPPTIIPITPLAGISVTPQPLIIATILDSNLSPPFIPSGIDETSIELNIDGNKVPHHYTTYIDGLTGVVSYQPDIPLTGGAHIINLTVSDKAGNPATNSWSFNSIWPEFSNFQPPDGSILNNPTPTISAKLSGGLQILDFVQDVTLKLDGQKVLSTYDSSTKIVSYTPSSPLIDKLHNVEVEVRFQIPCGGPITCWIVENFSEFFHLNFLITAASWSFTTAAALPDITNLSPADNSIINTQEVQISAKATAKSPTTIDPLSIVMKIDNNPVLPSFDEDTGIISYNTTLLDGIHNIYLKVKDTAGNEREVTWSFRIDTIAPILSNFTPADGSILKSTPSKIKAFAQDEQSGSGIDETSAKIKLNGQYVPTNYEPSSGTISHTPSALSDGTYNVTVEVKDKAGNIATAVWSFIVDSTPPVISDFTPSDGSFTPREVTISCKITDSLSGVNPINLKMQVNLLPVPAIYDGQTNILSYQTTLSEGIQAITVEALDLAGNISSTAWSFKVDTTPPTIIPITPADGTSVSPRPIISAYLTDTTIIPPSSGSGVDEASIKLSIDGNLIPHKYCTYIDGRGLIYYQPDTTLTGGPHIITIEASDKAGNQAIKSWSFTSIYPEWTNFQPQPSSFINNPQPQISAQLTGGQDFVDCLSKPEMKLDGNLVPADYNSTTRALSYLPSSPLPDGTHKVDVKLKLSIKQVNPIISWLWQQFSSYFCLDFTLSESTWSFTIDTIPPTITNLKPSDASFINTSTVLIQATAKDERSGIDPLSIIMKIDNLQVLPSFDETSGFISDETTLSDGKHSLFISIKDQAGNQTQIQWSFFVDTVPPIISNLMPIDDSQLNLSPSEISANISDPSPSSGIDLNSIVMKIQGNVVTPIFDEQTGKLSYILPQPLPDGNHTVTIDVQDKAGNSAETAISKFLIDTTPPIISIIQPQPGTFTNAYPKIIANITDPQPGSGVNPTTVILKIDNLPIIPDFDEQTGRLTYTSLSPLSSGTHTLQLSASDNVGNPGIPATLSFQVDGIPPVVTFIYPFDGQFIDKSLFEIKTNILDPQPSSGIDETKTLMKLDRNVVPAMYYPGNGNFNYILPYPLNPGTHILEINATDKVGNSQVQSINFIIDDQPPTISNCQPPDGSVLNTYTPNIFCTILDQPEGSGVHPLSISTIINGQVFPYDYDEVSGRLSVIIPSPLKEDTYNVTITAGDNLGNTTSYPFSFKIAIPPKITIITPLPNSIVGTEATILAELKDDTGIAADTISLSINESLYSPTYDLITGMLKCTVYFEVGIYNANVVLSVKDIKGNEASISWLFSIDDLQPQIIEQTPADPTVTNQPITEFSAIISDGAEGSGINTDPEHLYFFIIFAGDYQKITPTSITIMDSVTNKVKVTYLPSPPIKEGYIFISLYFEDNAGNWKYCLWHVKVDPTPPDITILKPLPDALVNKPDIEVQLKDNLTLINPDTIILKLNDTPYLWTFEEDLLTSSPSIPNGSYTITLTLSDEAGNQAVKSWNFTLNTTLPDEEVTPPEITNLTITPRYFNPTTQETTQISYDLNKPSKVTIKLVRIGPELKEGSEVKTLLSEQQPAGTYSLTWDGKDNMGAIVEDGAYKLKIQAVDSTTGAILTLPDLTTQKPQITNFTPTGTFLTISNDYLEIPYTLDIPAFLHMGVGLPEGPLVRTLTYWEPRIPGDHLEVWDGRDDAGNILEPGRYKFISSHISLPDNSVITYGNTPELTNLPQTDLEFNPYNNETMTIPWTLSEPSYVTIALDDEFNVCLSTLQNYELRPAGESSITFNGKDSQGNPYPEGIYSLSFDAQDLQGFKAKRKYIVVRIKKPFILVQESFVTLVPGPDNKVTSLTEDTVPLTVKEYYREGENTILKAEVLNKTAGPHQFQATLENERAGTTLTETQTVYFHSPLNLNPKISSFNPNKGEIITLSYNLSYSDKITALLYQNPDPCAILNIVDNKEQALRILMDNLEKPAGENTLTWNGKDKNGNIVSSGTYQIIMFISNPDRKYPKLYFEVSTIIVE